jgi:hypothetical protein
MRIQRRETVIMLQPTTRRHAASLRMLCRALVPALALLAFFAAPAAAEVEWLSTFGASGGAGGAFNRAAGLAINNETEDVYVADRENNRIQQFDSEGNFIRAWGFDVVASGPDQNGNEIQTLTVRATAGQFTLTFGGETTGDIESNASATEVETALNALTSISTGGGSVSVAGGPGDETGSSPYEVTFDGGPLANADVAQLVAANGTLPLSGGSPSSSAAVATIHPGAKDFEICEAAEGDVCKAGIAGGALGQFSHPRGVAVDNSPGGEGAIYVQDDENYRIQKFTFAAQPVLTFGKEVDKTTGGKICTEASGDVCGTGVKDTEPTPGTFNGWRYQGNQPTGKNNDWGNDITVDSEGHVIVGTEQNPNPFGAPYYGRVQKFEPDAEYLGQVFIPSIDLGRPEPLSVAADSTGRVYVAVGNSGESPQVQYIEPGDYTELGEFVEFLQRIYPNYRPKQVAIDPRNDRLLIGDANEGFGGSIKDACHLTSTNRAIVEFEADLVNSLQWIDCSIPTGEGSLSRISGLAVSPAGLAYASDSSANKVKIYKLPEETAPHVDLGGTFVASITQNTARVHTEVEPGFEPTSIRIEVGEDPCPSSCDVYEVPGILYGLELQGRTVQVEGLEAGTQYHYRVLAENSVGSDELADGTFSTYPFVDLVNDSCPNALARKQTQTVALLDCRAYELASAASSGGYDVRSDLVPGQTPFEGRPDASG